MKQNNLQNHMYTVFASQNIETELCVFFPLTGDNSYLSTVQILDSLGPRRVQVDRGGGAGCSGLQHMDIILIHESASVSA